jgi:hypothetical protein
MTRELKLPNRLIVWTFGTLAAIAVAFFVGASAPRAGQGPGGGSYRAPRTADGMPNLNGIWQALNEANWELLAHGPRLSPVIAFGAIGAAPPGVGVVEGNEIPYLPAALAKKNQNSENRLVLDPEVKCYLPGIPRATYMPYPFQVFQTPSNILIAYEYAGAARNIEMNGKGETPLDSWMGHSVGRWEGETLVVDVNAFNDQSWFDRAGDYHSDELKVTERYTRIAPDVLDYEATITDPQVFSRPWKIHMPLYRRLDSGARLMEFKCVELVEELMYGHLTKQGSE